MIKVVVPISGGKDSQACAKLAVEAVGAECVEGLFCDTRFEHPLTYAHVDRIADLYGIKIHRVCAGSVKEKIEKYKRFPGGGARFCTDELKLVPAKKFYKSMAEEFGGFEVWVGVRAGESHARQQKYSDKVASDLYPPHEIWPSKMPKYLDKMGVKFRFPIHDWTTSEVLEYLDGEENQLYREGFDRVGCFPCLAAGDRHKEQAFQFDEVGAEHLAMARSLEPLVGRSVFTSKGGKQRNDSGQTDSFSGCSICAI